MKLDRFLNVARYNLIINRAQYIKMALALFLIMSLPFLKLVMNTVWLIGETQSTEMAFAISPLTGMRQYVPFCFVVALPILCGYMFHNLLTKQSRIKELTLPATNGEKFLFHALMTVGGSFLVYVVGYFLIDLLQFFYVGIIYDFAHAEWIPYHGILFFDSNDSLWLHVVLILAWLSFCSTFVLGNALKYRHNVLFTGLFHLAFGFVSMFLFGLCSAVIVAHVPDWFGNFEVNKTMAKLGLTAFFLLIIVLCWWQSYRLFCRAQITTLRNK